MHYPDKVKDILDGTKLRHYMNMDANVIMSSYNGMHDTENKK